MPVVDVVLRGVDQGASGVVKSVTGSLGGLAGAAAAAMGAMAVGAGAAAAGFAAKSVSEFIGFQGKMNEVFTLLPGISEQAMGQMTAQVKGLSKEMGVLPEQVVPALYQSLSAGVPPDNVFDFIKVSQKAAVGGVTDLTTAVNGISSVVNAYGPSVLDAGRASDYMFTAVKQGKTTFGELSSSLFNVIPTAAAMKVGFGDVTAALASMTAQGVPTSVATTQLRQLLVELGKDGSATAKTFQQLAGVSFTQFIAKGGTLQGALQKMEQGAAKTGKSVADLFGSVEAGNAALSLTGTGTETFTNNLKAMADSAGATDKAYQRMDAGIGRSLDKLKSGFQVLMLDVGEKLAPSFAGFVDWALANVPKVNEVVTTTFTRVADTISRVTSILQGGASAGGKTGAILQTLGLDPAAATQVTQTVDTIIAKVGQLQGILTSGTSVGGQVGGILQTLGLDPAAATQVTGTIDMIIEKIRLIQQVIATASTPGQMAGGILSALGLDPEMATRAATVVNQIVQNLQTGFAGFVAALAPVQPMLAPILDLLGQLGQIVGTVVVGAFVALSGFIAGAMPGFGQIIAGAVQVALGVLQTLVSFIQGTVAIVSALIQGDWSGAWTAAQTMVSRMAEGVGNILRGLEQMAIGAVRGLVEGILAAFSNLVTGVTGQMTNLEQSVLNALLSLAGQAAASAASIINGIIAEFTDTNWSSIGTAIMNGIWAGIQAGWDWLTGRVSNLAGSLLDAAKQRLGISSPSTVFAQQVGLPIAQGIAVGITGGYGDVSRALSGAVTVPGYGGYGRGGGYGGQGMALAPITVNVNTGPISSDVDVQALAYTIASEISRRQRAR